MPLEGGEGILGTIPDSSGILRSKALSSFRAACAGIRPLTFLVLGSGLGAIVDRMTVTERLPFALVPGLPMSSVSGHQGEFVLGYLAGRAILVGAGRLHFYEGHPWPVVTWPIEFAAELGLREAILTNAAGGIRADLEPGQIMPLRDHQQWNPARLEKRTGGTNLYAAHLLRTMVEAGFSLGLALSPGVYAAVTGPSYETPAEIRALRTAGADAVGMSTTNEITAGVAAGMACSALSFITNRAAGLGGNAIDHAEVLDVGRRAAHLVGDLIEATLRRLA